MQPATINFCARPNFLYSAISRIDCTDSCCAGAMKLQVLTTSTSASPARGVISYPARVRMPIITSLSTRFLGHPRLTNPTLGIPARFLGCSQTNNSNTPRPLCARLNVVPFEAVDITDPVEAVQAFRQD